MLFPYIYVAHQIEKMQEFIDFIFLDLWCKAPVSGPYSLDLFQAKPELHDVMTAFHYDDSKAAEFYSGHVERIYGHFAALDDAQIDQFRKCYLANNDIEKVCANDPAILVTRYADLPADLTDVRKQLASFFKGIYSHLDVAALKAKIGEIDDHYRLFMATNKVGKCPFCGISDLLGEYHSRREAYDHYLPKALYPFNSINFRNLVPACHHCNSSYKTSKDPAYPQKDPARGTNRRKMFYPYRTGATAVEISVRLAHADLNAITPADIELQFGPAESDEELATWRDVYSVDERYRAKLLGDNDGKYWIVQALDEWSRFGSTSEYLNDLKQKSIRTPFAECNFLKNAFLQGCHVVGII